MSVQTPVLNAQGIGIHSVRAAKDLRRSACRCLALFFGGQRYIKGGKNE